MKIGVVLLLKGFGGVYQYTLSMLHAFERWRSEGCEDEFILFSNDLDHPYVIFLENKGWSVQPLQSISFVKKIGKNVLGRFVDINKIVKIFDLRCNQLPHEVNTINYNVIRFKPDFKKWFKSFGVELMIYPTAHPLSFETGIPYIMAIHDLQHRLQ